MAEFYGTVEAYKIYMTERGRVTDLTDDDEIAAALLVGSEWIDTTYLPMFQGTKVGGREQIREWPRVGVNDVYGYSIPSDSVPREVVAATYEAAQRQVDKPGSLNVDYVPGKYTSVTVYGAISVDYADLSSSADAQGQFTIIDRILAPLLSGNGSFELSSLSGGVVRGG